MMKKEISAHDDKVSSIVRTVLSVLYIPMSFFSVLLFMASESTIHASNPVYITLMLICCYVSLAVPLLCILCAAISGVVKAKGKLTAALCIHCIPLFVFLLNIGFMAVLEGIF